MASNDPDFEAKAADVIGLYLNPPAHAAVFCVDEKTAWLNQVEIWFAKIERDVIARGVFTSITDLKRQLMRYIHKYNDSPKPVKWVYRPPTHRITTDSRVTVHWFLSKSRS